MHSKRRGPRDERGAVIPMVALMMTVLLGVTAFAVDIGQQRVERRDAQAIADMVALDMARHLDGRTHAVIKATNEWRGTIAESVARNSNMSPLPAVSVQQQQEQAIATVAGSPLSVVVEMGSMSPAGVFTTIPYPVIPNAVKVTAKSAVNYAFVPGTGDVSRSAIAVSEGGACFAIGSYAARFDSGASPILGPLLGALGSSVALSAADYNGLANADVKLVDLLGAKVGLITLEEAIDAGQLVSINDFYVATLKALAPEQTAAIDVLNELNHNVGTVQIPVADLINIESGGASGLDADLNVLDLLTAAASAASKESGLAIDSLGISLGPIANVGTSLVITQPPSVGCGRKNSPSATADSAAVTLDVDASLANVTVPGLLKTSVKLSGTVMVASAHGELTDVRCGPEGMTAMVSDGLVDVDLRLDVTVATSIFGISVPVIGGPIFLTGQSTSNGEAVIDIDSPDDYDVPTRVTNSSSGLPQITADTSAVTLLGVPTGVVLSPVIDLLVSDLVNPLVDDLDVLLTSILNSLGLEVSGADVFVLRTPKCDTPVLRG